MNKSPMKLPLAAVTVAVGLAFAGPAFAASCPKDMKAIDAALGGANLSAADMKLVKELRAEGETLHKSGKHAASVASLHKAGKILGIR